jgi:hypothetical protein
MGSLLILIIMDAHTVTKSDLSLLQEIISGLCYLEEKVPLRIRNEKLHGHEPRSMYDVSTKPLTQMTQD